MQIAYIKNVKKNKKQKNIIFRMKNTKRKLNNQAKVVKASFTGSNITKYSGLNTIAKYMNPQNIVQYISKSFPTVRNNATKFGFNQILLAITLSSISGVSRICKIAAFSGDGLVKTLLKLDKAINENAISATLKNLGQNGARKLQMLLLSKNAQWVHESGLESITLDTDSTVKSVCGNQEGAAKGYNTTKRGAISYHPLLVFVSELKLLYHTWFRTSSTYTSNGIVDFLKEVKASLPKKIKKVFIRADSWVFAGVAICEFSYTAKGWSKPRMLKAMRSVKGYARVEYLGQVQIVPVYQYVYYASSFDLNAIGLHELYKQRSTSETWIEQVKKVKPWQEVC
jgi:hypothetical protein